MNTSTPTLPLIDLRPEGSELETEVLAGLRAPRKTLACKWLYDERGSALFEEIVDLPEYYPTRTEIEILRLHGNAIARRIGPRALIAGFGTGSGTKERLLLACLRDPAGFLAIDIAPHSVLEAARRLAIDFPDLPIQPICADYLHPFDLDGIPASLDGNRRVGFFPGSTIGNLSRGEARAFLGQVAAFAGPGGGLLVGIDLAKDRVTLEAAYNDSAGVTAEFDKNALLHVNHALGADFDPERFEHIAVFDEIRSCIEMHLVSLAAQVVHVGAHAIEFRAGESILTETSTKWNLDDFETFVAEAGFAVDAYWTDARRRFAVVLLTC